MEIQQLDFITPRSEIFQHLNSIYHGQAENVLPRFAPESIQSVVTSPPYADQRTTTYLLSK